MIPGEGLKPLLRYVLSRSMIRPEEVMIPGEGLKLATRASQPTKSVARRGHDPWRGIETRRGAEEGDGNREPEEVMIPGEGLKRT